jgi:IS30 family transposase
MPARMDPAVRRRVFDLLWAGMPSVAVAEVVGVSAPLVRKWRAQVGGVIPAPAQQLSDRYLDREERYEIARLREQGLSIRAVAARIGRDPTTVMRELKRHRAPRSGRYEPERAHTEACRGRRRPKTRKLDRDPRLHAWVQQRLDERYSPEQIAGRLPVEFPDEQQMRICHETIYQALYVRGAGQLRRELRAHLRTGRTQRRRRGSRSRYGPIRDAVSIRERPEEIEGRQVPGHWEGDLVMGSTASNSAVGSLVERTTGFLRLLHLPHGHTADAVADAIIAAAPTLPPVLAARSITWDRGRELAAHKRIKHETEIAVYFADPHSPWQRGSNENTNGLLREYLPKGTNLSCHSAAELQRIQDQLNNRPRKRLGFLTPIEAMTKLIIEDQHGRCCDVT